jgi:hypothetical protein
VESKAESHSLERKFSVAFDAPGSRNAVSSWDRDELSPRGLPVRHAVPLVDLLGNNGRSVSLSSLSPRRKLLLSVDPANMFVACFPSADRNPSPEPSKSCSRLLLPPPSADEPKCDARKKEGAAISSSALGVDPSASCAGLLSVDSRKQAEEDVSLKSPSISIDGSLDIPMKLSVCRLACRYPSVGLCGELSHQNFTAARLCVITVMWANLFFAPHVFAERGALPTRVGSTLHDQMR